MKPLRVAVVGVGSFGRNHARVYHDLQNATASDGPRVELAAVVDASLERAEAIAREFNCRAYTSLDKLLAGERDLTAASVCVPTVAHLEVARTLLNMGVDVLIEKPVAATVAEADELIA